MREIGLALSGGGARGIAHLGVLAALDELEIPIARLVGVSSGAIVGAFYAAGFKPAEVLRLFTAMPITRLLRPAFSRHGLLNLDALKQLLEEHLGGNFTFADLQRPLTLVATDLVEGVSVYFSEGPLLPALLGSSAVPVLYRPVEYQGRQLVDGGLLNNLPVEPLLDQNVVVVGVHCNPVNPAARITTFRSLVERTLLLGINANTPARRLRCDLLIEPPELRNFRTLSYRRATELYDIGYRYTMSLAPQLRALQ
ncbi:patatin-like phospholipase family protein [Hymenobacter sp. BT188]|uniref:patatin-like phospholipase family protein n=1 Tax=Hymenobacter sp. BT188 TaxID=2763504 RepID=UPI00165163E4|nr:patatin-like phospholipase family protein [Hymenobacter sp. BT188]MBC6605703.1 patatin-like phospholipase family protein [Hymenobacter sp. BT188]